MIARCLHKVMVGTNQNNTKWDLKCICPQVLWYRNHLPMPGCTFLFKHASTKHLLFYLFSFPMCKYFS